MITRCNARKEVPIAKYESESVSGNMHFADAGGEIIYTIKQMIK